MIDHSNHQRREQKPINLEKNPLLSFKTVNWGRLFGYVKPYWKQMGLAALALLISTGMGLAFPLIIVRMLDTVTQTQDFGPLNTLAGVLAVIFLLQAVFNFLQSYLLAYTGERIVFDLRTSLYTHLQKLSLDFYAARRVGDLVSRLSSDVTQMRSMLTTNITMLLSQILTLVGSIIIVFTMNAQFTLFILALVPVLIGVAMLFGGRILKSSTQTQDQLANSTVVAEEGLQGIRVVKSFGREDYETQRYKIAMQKTFQTSLQMAVYNSLFSSLMMFLGLGTIGAIMWYGGHEVIAGRLTLAMITGFLIYGISIATSLGGLGALYGQLNAAVGGVQRVFEILDTQPDIKDAPDAISLPSIRGQVSFKEVSFSYDQSSPVLQNVSFDIQAGEILALVGPSGAGKSTIFNLLPRFYDPTAGSICIDGIDLHSIDLINLHKGRNTVYIRREITKKHTMCITYINPQFLLHFTF